MSATKGGTYCVIAGTTKIWWGLSVDSEARISIVSFQNTSFSLLITGDNIISTPPLVADIIVAGAVTILSDLRFPEFVLRNYSVIHFPQFSSATILFSDTKIHRDFPLKNTHF